MWLTKIEKAMENIGISNLDLFGEDSKYWCHHAVYTWKMPSTCVQHPQGCWWKFSQNIQENKANCALQNEAGLGSLCHLQQASAVPLIAAV